MKNVANIFFDQWVCLYGLPEDIVSDTDKKFTRDIRRLMTTLFHLIGDGRTECSDTMLNMYLHKYVALSQLDWIEFLRLVEFCYNTTIHSKTGYMPFGIAHGFDGRKP